MIAPLNILNDVNLGIDENRLRRIEIKVRQKYRVSSFLQFVDDDHHRDYKKFKRSTFQPEMYALVIFFQALIYSISIVFNNFFEVKHNEKYDLYFKVFDIFFAMVLVLGVITLVKRTTSSESRIEYLWFPELFPCHIQKLDNWINVILHTLCIRLPSTETLESINAISAHIGVANYLIVRCYVGSCAGYYSRLSLRCNAVAEGYDIPGLDTWCLLVMPAYYQFGCRGISWSTILIIYVLNIITVCWCTSAAGNSFDNGWIGGALGCIVMFGENERQWIATYLTTLLIREVTMMKNNTTRETISDIEVSSKQICDAVAILQGDLRTCINPDLMRIRVTEDVKTLCAQTVNFMDNLKFASNIDVGDPLFISKVSLQAFIETINSHFVALQKSYTLYARCSIIGGLNDDMFFTTNFNGLFVFICMKRIRYAIHNFLLLAFERYYLFNA